MCLLAGTCEVKAEEPSAEVHAAFRKLAEAPNHTFESRAGMLLDTPQITAETTGVTERDGWSHLTETSPSGTYEFVFKKRKGLIKIRGEWKSVAQLMYPWSNDELSESMHREILLLTGGELPVHEAGKIATRITTFKKEGEFYTCELTAEETGKALGMRTKKGQIDPKAFVRVRIEQGFPVLLEFKQPPREGGKKSGYIITTRFSDIGKTKVEVPAEARQRMEQVLLSMIAEAAFQPAGANLSRAQALEVAKKMQEQLAQIHKMLSVHAIGNNGRFPEGKTSNEVFRALFQNGICEDEMLFVIPDTRARPMGKLPDGIMGGVDDGFSKALSPGECDITYVTPLPAGAVASPNRPLLRADIKASDGTVVVIVALAHHTKPYILETRDGILYDAPPNNKVDLFSAAAGVEPAHILMPAPAQR